jgi:hypothetical protein
VTRADLDATNRAQITGVKTVEIVFLSLTFPSGALSITTGVKNYTFSSLTFVPGAISLIDTVSENPKGQPERPTIALSGCDASLIASCRDDACHWVQVRAWLGYANAAHNLVNTPLKIFDGYLGAPTIQLGEKSNIINITCETLNAALASTSLVRGCDADQQVRSAGDTLFHQVGVNRERQILVAGEGGGGGAVAGGNTAALEHSVGTLMKTT